MHAAAWKEQQHFRARMIRSIKLLVSPQETVVAHDLAPGFRVFKGGVEAHRRATVRGQLGDGRANADAFIFAECERLVVEGAADVTRLQRALAQHASIEVCVIRRIAGAVPEIVFVTPPQLAWKQTTLIAVDLVEVAQVIPLRDYQIRFQRPAKLHEDLVERSLVGDRAATAWIAPGRARPRSRRTGAWPNS